MDEVSEFDWLIVTSRLKAKALQYNSLSISYQ
ncbi:hypothetical protein BN8_05045 [Fibrisoma limi BUZ 3]|uniref:Uncharacterized protein n=1 Tax=Fibrisoma limi BUZ 3 TaxID=1185876 RepID=I2GPD2_9BACT|nr:hypothetical protein BN8_05045 [Fibrisoma limi BUZ 3]